jgi:HK97 family phage major capsid protein
MGLVEQKNTAIERMRALSGDVKSLIEKVEAGTATAEELASVDTKSAEIKQLESELKTLNALIEQKEAAAKAAKEWAKPVNDFGQKLDSLATMGNETKNATNADTFLSSQEFKNISDSLAQFKGQLPKGFRVNTQPVEVKTLINTGVSSFGNMISAERLPGLDTVEFSKPLTLLNLITRSQTSSNIVEYHIHTGFTNSAANVPEATATGGGSGAKPESGMGVVTTQQALVRTISHYLPVTRQALQDIPALRTLINQALTFGMQERLESQILSGDGLGENLLGILNTPGITTIPFNGDEFDTLRTALTAVQIGGRTNPNAIVIHPNDWELLETKKDTTGQYFSGNPFRNTTFSANIWGVPVVTNESITPGEALIGNFAFATLWESLSPVILLSDSHLDFFTRNLIALLGEMRAAFGVIRPSAFKRVALA